MIWFRLGKYMGYLLLLVLVLLLSKLNEIAIDGYYSSYVGVVPGTEVATGHQPGKSEKFSSLATSSFLQENTTFQRTEV